MNAVENNIKDKELTPEEKMLRQSLKSKDILDRKPNLKICSNHRKVFNNVKRMWFSESQGAAIRDGNGWYKRKV